MRLPEQPAFAGFALLATQVIAWRNDPSKALTGFETLSGLGDNTGEYTVEGAGYIHLRIIFHRL